MSIAGQQRTECKRSAKEALRCEGFRLSHTVDGGASWRMLPMRQTIWGRLLSLLTMEWPPVPTAFGWKHGKIAVAHADLHEDGSPNLRYVSTFDEAKGRWSTRTEGMVSDTRGTAHWWEGVGFDTVVSARPIRTGGQDAV